MNHKKPTQEELDQSIAQSLQELEKEPEIESDIEEDKTEEKTDETLETKTEQEEEKQPEPNYKKKFVESTREAQILHSRNKQINEAIDKANEIDEPSEEEMTREFSNWEDMDEVARRLAKDNLMNRRRFEIIHQASQAGKDIEKWNSEVDQFLDDPQSLINHPAIEGKQEEFKIFATKPTRRGIDFSDLVSAFLYTYNQKKVKSQGAMFEAGTGGPNSRPADTLGKISIEQGRQLRKSDYKKYKELLIAGKISNE